MGLKAKLSHFKLRKLISTEPDLEEQKELVIRVQRPELSNVVSVGVFLSDGDTEQFIGSMELEVPTTDLWMEAELSNGTKWVLCNLGKEF